MTNCVATGSEPAARSPLVALMGWLSSPERTGTIRLVWNPRGRIWEQISGRCNLPNRRQA